MVSFIGCQFDSDGGDELSVISVCAWILLAVWTLAWTFSRGFDRFVVLRFQKEFGIWRADGGKLVSSGAGRANHLAAHDFSSDTVDRLRGDREANGPKKRLISSGKAAWRERIRRSHRLGLLGIMEFSG